MDINKLKGRYFALVNNNGCFCGKCGKKLLNDSYNLKKHQKDCVEYANTEKAIKDGEQYGYAFKIKDDNLIFLVYALKLELRPGFNDRYCGSKWKVVFKATFSKNSKVLKEEGLYNIDVWFKMLLEATDSICLNVVEPEKIIRNYFKSIPFVYSYGDFLDIYRQRGYTYNNIDIDKVKNIPESTCNIAVNNSPVVYVFEHEVDSEVILELIAYNRRQKIGRMFISKDFYYTDEEEFDINKAFGLKGSVQTVGYTFRVQKERPIYKIVSMDKFNKKYPELLVEQYLNSGGTNIFQAVMSQNYNKMIENLCKCGLGYIADRAEELRFVTNINIYGNNIKEIFGYKQNIIKIFNKPDTFDFLQKSDIFDVINKVRQIQPAIVSMPISGTGLSLLYYGFTNTSVNKTGYEMVCTFNKDEIKKLIQITNEHGEDIVYYKDYWRMAKALDALPYGKIPKNIKEAHDYICEIYEYHKDKMLSEAFHYSVTRPEYLLFDSTAELDKDNKIHYKKNESEYRIIVPKVQRDLTKESESLNHCVRTYIGAVAKCDTFILFLRKSDNLTKSFATIEVTKDMRLIQLKAINNTMAPKDAQDFVKQWAKEKHIRIDSCDIR